MLQWTLMCIYLFKLLFLLSPDKYPEIELLDHMAVLSFLRNRHTVFHSGCTNLHSLQQYTKAPFSLHPHRHSGFVFLIIAILIHVRWYISSWFWFAFLWWLVMLNIFFCVCWQLGCLFWKSVYLVPLFMFCFSLNCFLDFELYGFLCIVDVNTLSDIAVVVQLLSRVQLLCDPPGL